MSFTKKKKIHSHNELITKTRNASLFQSNFKINKLQTQHIIRQSHERLTK
ncbi:hypothetical protein HYC85_012319 [Camellia sinensis]|uniref:Uncharacterized protein n=1 Tax=Camellia sinensis TaxID=4442 RepID=A0A7J7HET9_CAMSI|nr:hypothetical protein HYC85_012319 [Camellia sinensis]